VSPPAGGKAILSHTNVVNDVAFSPDGRILVSVGADGYAFLWGIDPKAAVAELCQALRGPALASQWAGLHAGIGPPPC
jgi:WD40 repeat protein